MPRLNDKQAIARLRQTLEEWYIKGIESTFEATSKEDSGSPLMAFILAVCLVDTLAGYYCGRNTTRGYGRDFNRFVNRYIRPLDSSVADYLYKIRCNLVHDFTLPSEISLTHANDGLHNQQVVGGSIQNFENVFRVIQDGMKSYFDELSHSNDLKRNFRERSGAFGSVGPRQLIN